MIVALALGLALAIQAWLVKPYQIPSESMEPTLDVGQRVLVNRFLYHFTDPSIGDIVVFHPPEGADEVAAPNAAQPPPAGQACDTPDPEGVERELHQADRRRPRRHAQRSATAPVVNGGSEQRHARSPTRCPAALGVARRVPDGCNLPKPITIPPDHYFMMGDNRGASDDSRFWGPVPRDWIIGKAFATYWPPDRIGIF